MPKVRIISAPKNNMAYGGQHGSPNFTLDVGGRIMDITGSIQNPFQPSSSMQPVDRDEASLEAEKGETLLRTMPDGKSAQFTIAGKPHSQGGTPLSGEAGDFIFPVTKKMALGGDIVEQFGKSAGSNKKYPIADLAKQYELNKYQALVDNPDSDKLTKTTAQRMVDNSLRKLQELAFITEQKKGFPDGLPQIQGSNPQGQIQAKFGGLMKAQDGFNGVPMSLPGKSPFDPQYLAPDQSDNQVPDLPNYTNPDPYAYERMQKYSNPEIAFAANPFDTNPHPGTGDFNNPPQKSYGTTRGENSANLAALYAAATTQRYTPYAAPIPTPQAIQPLLASPERGIAALQSNAADQELINAYSGEGARQRSVNSSIQGQAASHIGDIIAQTNEKNIPEVNRINQANEQARMAALMARSQQLTGVHAAGQEMDQKYRDALNQRFANISKTQQETEKNEMYRNLTNAFNPNFEYLPQSSTVRFRQGYHDPFETSASSNDPSSEISQLAAKFKASGVAKTDEEASQMAYHWILANRTSTTTAPFNPKANRSRVTGPTQQGYGDYGVAELLQDYGGYDNH